MKRDKELENILDECLERLLVKGETLEQCLESYPEHRDELEPLLEVAVVTRQALAVQPRPEFRERARYQFRQALQEAESRGRRFSLGWFPRWATVATLVLCCLVVGGGTVVSASTSMPDEPLYPLKLATEQVQLALTPSDMGKAEMYAELTDRRVEEIVYMAGKGDVHQIEAITARMDSNLTALTALTMGDVVETPPDTFSATQDDSAWADEAAPEDKAVPEEGVVSPEEEEPSAGRAPLMAEAGSTAGRNGQAGASLSQQDELRMTLESNAARQTAALRAALEEAPESAKPALQEAISVSIDGYNRVRRNLD
jgi:hypothetical protein